MSSTGKRSSRWRLVLVAVILFSSGLGVGILAAPPSSNGVWSGDWIREKYAYFSSGLQLPFTTAGRVLIAGAGGNVTTDSDLSFSGQMLTATDLKFTNDFYWGASNRTAVLAYPEQAASYVIWKDGSTYYAKNGHTGAIDFSGAVASTVIQATLGGLTGGRTWYETILLKGTFSIKTSIKVPDYTIIDASSAILINTVDSTTKGRIIENSDTVGGNSFIKIIGGKYLGTGYVTETLDDDAALLYLLKINHLTLEDIYVGETCNRGIYITNYCDDVKLSNVVARACGTAANRAIAIGFGNASNIQVNNLYVADNYSQFAFVIAQIIGGTFNNIVTYNNHYYATELAYDASHVTISNLNSHDDAVGLYFKMCHDVSINGYTFTSNAVSTGIYFDSVTEAKTDIIVSNFVIDCQNVANSISIDGKMDLCARIKFSDGIIKNTNDSGPSFYETTVVGTDLTVDNVEFYNINGGAFGGQFVLKTSMTYSRIINCVFRPVNNVAYGLYLRTGGDYATVMENDFEGTYTSMKIQQDAATGHVIKNNRGYVTENSGTGVNIALHATHAHVTHGLAYTPSAADIGITWTTSLTNCTSWSVTGISSTEFVVTLYDANGAEKGPSGTVTFSWKAIKTP